MTSNGSFDEESPLPWLQSVGFHLNPFSLPFAENQPTDMFQQTYFVADELEQLMLDQEKSVAFLAPYGGGKTAARRYTQFRWEEQYPHAFITVYDNFTAVAEQLPNVKLSTHREPLLAATAEAFWGCISKWPQKLLALPEVWQLWWWALLHHYLPGALLEFRVYDVPELVDSYSRYVQKGDERRPFRPNEELPTILHAIHDRLAKFGFIHWLLLVDDIDNTLAHNKDALSKILTPLVNTPSLFRDSITWKFFLAESALDVLEGSLARSRSGLEIIQPNLDKEESKKLLRVLLQNRLRWASNGAIDSLNRFAQEIEVDEELIKLVLNNPGDLGPVHRLLFFGDMLASSLEIGTISRSKWHSFIQKTSKVYFQEKPFGITETLIEEEKQNTPSKKINDVPETDLLRALDNHFNRSELIILAHSLEVNVEELEGSTLKEQAISLIKYLKRRDRYYDLVEAVCKERPNATMCKELSSTTS